MVGAPGNLIQTTDRGGQYALRLGTSPATPSIAGILALGLATNPNVQPQRLIQLLKASVEPVQQFQGKFAWGGKVNAYKFLQFVKQG